MAFLSGSSAHGHTPLVTLLSVRLCLVASSPSDSISLFEKETHGLRLGETPTQLPGEECLASFPLCTPRWARAYSHVDVWAGFVPPALTHQILG
jgi:hypothetical protein